MPDLLTHVLVAYVVLTPATWWLPWLDERFVSVAMIGATVPDAAKLALVVDPSTVEAVLGLPFDWEAVHTLGPAATLAAIGTLCFGRGNRLRAFGCLLAGVCSHLLLDLTVVRAGGMAPPYLFPVTWWEPPAANVLSSSDPWPWMVTATVVIGVWTVDRRRRPAGEG